jgi:hypothetical protein
MGTQSLETMEKMTADLAVHLGKVNRIAANISIAKSAGAAASAGAALPSAGDIMSVALSPGRSSISNISASSGKEQPSYSLMGQGTGGGLDETSLALRKFLENEQKERRSAEAKVNPDVGNEKNCILCETILATNRVVFNCVIVCLCYSNCLVDSQHPSYSLLTPSPIGYCAARSKLALNQ